jgi:hypothetical protein
LQNETNNSVLSNEKKREEDAKLDKYLDTRFGDKAEGQ